MDYQTEEQQVEALKKWWDENGTSLVVGATLGVGAILGWQYWKDSVNTKREAASAAYQAVLDKATSDDGNTKPLDGGDAIIEEYKDTVYAPLMAFQLAKQNIDKNDLATAETHLREALELSQDKNLQHIARTRLANVLVAQNKLEDALSLIDNIESGTYKARYDMIKGNIYSLQGHEDKATKAYQSAKSSHIEGIPEHPNLKFRLDQTSFNVDIADVDA